MKRKQHKKASKREPRKPARKSHKPTVRGPQLGLAGVASTASGAVPEGVREGRTPVAQEHHSGARTRYLERPKKRKGNPFVAVRVPHELRDAWRAWLKKKNRESAPAMREAMAKLCGFKGDTEGGEDGDE